MKRESECHGRARGAVTTALAALALGLALAALTSPAVAKLGGGRLPAPRPAGPSAAELRPTIVRDLIPYGERRRAQMADYSQRHYGFRTSWLTDPKVVVLHFTAGGTYASAYWTFRANTPNKGELPGVSSHFVIDKDGTIYQLVPLTVRARHCIGLNHRSISIEFVQEAGAGSHWADQQILARRRQVDAGLRLVRYLMARYGIEKANVIGHAMANDSPFFKDLRGWRNTHNDWQAADVREFRSRL
jgi:N-acetylmuramoyl-L-alanine amidase